MGVGQNWVPQKLDTSYWTQTISGSKDSSLLEDLAHIPITHN